MKVCYVISTPSVAGGANRSLLDLISQLKKQNKSFTCFVLASGSGTMQDELERIGVKCYILTYAKAVKGPKIWKTIGKRLFNIYAMTNIIKVLKKEKPDILHNNSLPTTIGMEAALKIGIPYICHIRENVWDGLGMRFYSPKTVKKVMEYASSVIAISNYIKKSYDGFFTNYNTVVMNDGIVIEDYFIDKREILLDQVVNILIVGVINPQKGQKDAVEAIEKLTQAGYLVQLTILGADGRWNDSTSYADDLRKYVKENSLSNVKFADPIDETDELKLFRSRFDINLICSYAEGLGRTTIESMLSGALTIAANAGATSEILTDKRTGLLYKSGNVDQLARCIEWSINNKREAREIAKLGQKEAVRRFSINEYSSKMMDLYESLVKNHGTENKAYSKK